MWTPSHFLLTAFAAERLRRRRSVPLGPLLAGAVMPDVPLVALTLGYAAWRRLAGTAGPGEGLYAPGFDHLFFRDPLWVTLHNSLHAPLVLLVVGWIGWATRRRGPRWGAGLCWFAAGCAFHTVLDVATHTHDGPLVLFPLNWTYRIASPVSYWHPAHFGAVFSRLEWTLDLAVLIYFALRWRRATRWATERIRVDRTREEPDRAPQLPLSRFRARATSEPRDRPVSPADPSARRGHCRG
jgi:hypothetical protein